MAVVLGVDAAWTEHHPSGVALAAGDGNDWTLLRVSPSYAHFTGAAGVGDTPRGERPNPESLLTAAASFAGRPVDLVAFDMPLANSPIAGRRTSDIGVSSAFGGQGAATHSPGAERPGKISDALTKGFAALGYPLAVARPTGPAIAEVYPHPALIRFLGKPYRLPYKLSRTRQYWPDLASGARRARLVEIWSEIVGALDRRMTGVAATLPLPAVDAPPVVLKAFEDQLDAIICACVGAAILAGEAEAFGDDDSAIWVPLAAARA